MKGILKKRNPNSHKGTYGKVGIIAGSKGMTGSAYLASNAALRTGSGLVYNIVSKDILDIMTLKYIEPIAKSFDDINSMMGFLENLNSLCVGPGMGTEKQSEDILKAVLSVEKSLLVDADGINLLAKNLDLLKSRKYPTVLTPHTVEFSRLTGLSPEYINKNRVECAENFTKEYDVTLVLKGHNTIVASKDKTYMNVSGNPGMATAGSGDVLSGIITSLLGRNIDSFDAAKLGVFMHGMAGDFAADTFSMDSLVASDIINNLHKVFRIEELY
ncbi:NAD(P)H-hydrate dehydratase [Peptoniphilus asaccharolyticus]|nr:NAD(P)H-hydrate dehydratase [Peptoniphilus asaccharolyticus]